MGGKRSTAAATLASGQTDKWISSSKLIITLQKPLLFVDI